MRRRPVKRLCGIHFLKRRISDYSLKKSKHSIHFAIILDYGEKLLSWIFTLCRRYRMCYIVTLLLKYLEHKEHHGTQSAQHCPLCVHFLYLVTLSSLITFC